MGKESFSVLLLCVLVQISTAHVCLMYPPQRGGYDISTPASYSCYQPTAPCGTTPPQQPTFTLEGGKTFNVLLQQNLNHYNPGFPGFIDVGYAVGTNQTADSDFITLATVPDYWPHFQGTQTNFSIPVVIPDIDCDWCTLQVRYHPNKPTEPIFHNCADVKILPTPIQEPSGTYLGITKVGPEYAASEDFSSVVSLDVVTGTVEKYLQISSHIGQRSSEFTSAPLFRVANGMIAPAVESGLVFFGYGELDQKIGSFPSSTFFHFSTGLANMTSMFVTMPAGIAQFDAIINTFSETTPAPYIVVGQTENPTEGLYTFSVFWFWANGTFSDPIGTSSPDQIYVNFFWADYNPCAGTNGQIYLLVGDENSLVDLNVKLFTFDIATGSVSSVLVNNSMYTLSSIHAWPEGDCKNLYSVSPGLVSDEPEKRVWNLVTVDPVSGDVFNPVAVSKAGEYTQYYGGAVYGKSVNTLNQMAHLFRREIDSSFEVKLINLQTRSIDSTASVNLGVNSLLSLSTLVYFPPK